MREDVGVPLTVTSGVGIYIVADIKKKHGFRK